MDISLFPKEVQDRFHEILAIGLRRKIARIEAEKKEKELHQQKEEDAEK